MAASTSRPRGGASLQRITDDDRASVATLFEQNAPLQKILDKAHGSIAAALRGPVEVPALIKSALLQIAMTPALQSAVQSPAGKMSAVEAIMQAASLGLMVGGPAGEAAMVPYKGKVKLIPMVRGLATLAIRSGSVLAITPRAVYHGDRFVVQLGTADTIEHVPDMAADRSKDENIDAVYAIFKMAGGVIHFDWMNRAEVERVRASSKAKDEGPWVDWWGEQAKKTIVKRAAKMVPLSPEFRAAVELDNRFETGTVNEPSELLDTVEETAAVVMDKTAERAANLRRRLDPEEAAELDRRWRGAPMPKRPTKREQADAAYFRSELPGQFVADGSIVGIDPGAAIGDYPAISGIPGECPECHHRCTPVSGWTALDRSVRHPAIQCGNCGVILQTTLDAWETLKRQIHDHYAQLPVNQPKPAAQPKRARGGR